MADLWVINPKHVPKPNSAHEGDYEKFKRLAEIRMRQYDRLPKTVRRAVNQFGRLADARRWRYATEKIDAVKRAYQACLSGCHTQTLRDTRYRVTK